MRQVKPNHLFQLQHLCSYGETQESTQNSSFTVSKIQARGHDHKQCYSQEVPAESPVSLQFSPHEFPNGHHDCTDLEQRLLWLCPK